MKHQTNAPSASERKSEMTAVDFEAMSPAQKQKFLAEIESTTPAQRRAESRPLNATEKERWKRVKKKVGRPPVGKGIKLISLSIERGLLDRADAYASSHGISRAKLIAMGLSGILDQRQKSRAS